ncbi:immunoglobulin-like and fibronectin type III domain-containing protein 1 [Salvelinus alpinus]|uniref:immunoglobulin-like and fibronectin type III domain-containing protein 1 n=1 Tax=Salvelinus alpinus TaxID=8036 RepID=UPI0039FBCA7D
MLSSPKKDYEKVCMEYGVTDFRWMLKQLNLKKTERDEEQAKVVEKLENLKHIEVKTDGSAEFELDMELKNPNSQVFLFKDGVMVPYSDDGSGKHNLNKIGKKYIFSINNLMPDDAGLYQVDVEDANCFSTDFKIIPVEFVVKIQEVKAKEREDAVFECVLSHPFPKIVWTGKNIPLEQGDKFDITVSEDHLVHSLKVKDCAQVDKGVYTAMAGIASCNAWLIVEDRGVQFLNGLADINGSLGETVELSCKLSHENCEGVWLKDGRLVTPDDRVKIITDGACHKLVIDCCRKDDGAVYRFEVDGRISEATLTVQHPPTFNMDSLREFSKPVIVRACETAEWKLAFSGGDPMKIKWIKEDEELLEGPNVKIEQTDIKAGLCITDCQRRNCGEVKINIKNDFGTLEATSRLIVLGYPGSPSAPKVVSAFKDCINLAWSPPINTGGTEIWGYNLERRKKGSNFWSTVNLDGPIKDTTFALKDVIEGAAYEFRVSAINISGVGEPSPPSVIVFARDPKKPPGKVIDLKLTDSSYTTFSLAWTKPKEVEGVEDEAKGYFVEIRPNESPEWTRCNINPIISTSFNVIGLKAMGMYWVRVIATNDGGEGEPQGFDNYIIAMPPPVRPQFTGKMKSFMVVRKGNTVRFNINFKASPLPDIYWLKDCVPVSKRVTITNSDRGSQLLIPTSERSDTGIFTIIVKNMVGQETFSVEIRVTDDPKPPGPVELEQNVPGTVTVTWTPSPDEKKDDRLHYIVYKRDSVKRTWRMVADSLFNHKFTVTNILPGREYNFRVFAKNDMGLSEPAVSPTWGTIRRKDKFILDMPDVKGLDLQCPPSFLLRLKIRTAPPGYECYMSCAVRGDPKPHVTWYHNNVSLNTNTNYLITNVCGVCTMLILKIGPKDSGDYSVIADSPLGRAECSTKLTVRE